MVEPFQGVSSPRRVVRGWWVISRSVVVNQTCSTPGGIHGGLIDYNQQLEVSALGLGLAQLIASRTSAVPVNSNSSERARSADQK